MIFFLKDVFEDTRSILEPAGALALAGLKKYVAANPAPSQQSRGLVAIASGANMNFDRLRFADYVMGGIEPMSTNGLLAQHARSNLTNSLFVGTTTTVTNSDPREMGRGDGNGFRVRSGSGSSKNCSVEHRTNACHDSTSRKIRAPALKQSGSIPFADDRMPALPRRCAHARWQGEAGGHGAAR